MMKIETLKKYITYLIFLFLNVLCDSQIISSLNENNFIETELIGKKSQSSKPNEKVWNCPNVEDEPVPIPFTTHIFINLSSQGKLCSLIAIKDSKRSTSKIEVPIARSYDGYDWEILKGSYQHAKSTCFDEFCNISVPSTSIPSDHHRSSFILSSFSESSLNFTIRDKASQFLEQTTFGPTLESIESLTNNGEISENKLNENLKDWLYDQIMTVPATSHREYFRKRSNNRLRSSNKVGIPLHPCSPNTRWHSYTFNPQDTGASIYVSRTFDDSAYLLSIDDIPRTEIGSVMVGKTSFLEVGKYYQICKFRSDSKKFDTSDLQVVVGGSCKRFVGGNPPIRFSSHNFTSPSITLTLNSNQTQQFQNLTNNNYFNFQGLHAPECERLHTGSFPVYLDLSDGNWLAFDPRINLIDNSLDNVSRGKDSQNKFDASCSDVPRTFLNEDSCYFSTEMGACGRSSIPDIAIPLTAESIAKLQNHTNVHIYALSGLVPYASPCKSDQRSRWKQVDASNCASSPTTFTNMETHNTLQRLLIDAEGSVLKDITFTSQDNATCDVQDTVPSSKKRILVQAESMCWELAHPDYNEVYDMTFWMTENEVKLYHYGNFAVNNSAFLDLSDNLTQWETKKHMYHLLGRLENSVSFRDLPSNLQLESVQNEFEVGGVNQMNAIVICGSPGEIKNDHKLIETRYNMQLDAKDTDFNIWELEKQRQVVWTSIVLSSSDQLRQRMAWALSQIFAISPEQMNLRGQTEMFHTYYDIFVRHAFGNFKDILKEVSYSPAMGIMLSYRSSKSSSYQMKKWRKLNFPDENFAREVMQLFSIGKVLLNKDGTPKIDPLTSKTIVSYSNDHIMSFARAWTGFDLQPARGNIEVHGVTNLVDPMRIIPEWRDIFPKINLSGGFIGDGYPLCVDMPDQFFLRKGAKYRLLGTSSTSELQSHPEENVDPHSISLHLSKNSLLYYWLCKPHRRRKDSDKCRLRKEVILGNNVPCMGQECNLDTVRLVQVAEGIFFEYIDPPCVRLPYYDSPKKISLKHNSQVMCEDPRSITASEACCERDLPIDRNCEYVGEQMSFKRAKDRCELIGKSMCKKGRPPQSCTSGCCSSFKNYLWKEGTCKLQVKINHLGLIALVQEPEISYDRIRADFNSDTNNFFPVYWADKFPSLSNNCGNGTCQIIGESCLCEIEVIESSVFNAMPNSTDDILSQLFIGSFNPDVFKGAYDESPLHRSGNVRVYFENGSPFNKNTVFELDSQSGMRYYKNIKSIVRILNSLGGSTDFSFRNPPHFMNLAQPEIRDAQYETDAVLDNYFYHPNTAPFLANLLIQRFGISNPSKRYVEEVANAFSTGTYRGRLGQKDSVPLAKKKIKYFEKYKPSTFGNGNYGDLQATIAAIILDREARSSVVKADPTTGSLREPLLKFLGLMKSMEFKTFEDYSEIEMLNEVATKIGEMAHEAETVFSFFQQDFATSGPVLEADLVAPEGQRYDTTTIVGLLNGMYSLVKYGLTSCFQGLGQRNAYARNCEMQEGDFSKARGMLTYLPSNPDNAESVVNELATLLTGGRLNQISRELIQKEYTRARDKESGLRLAQQLLVTMPEFHSTNSMDIGHERLEKSKFKKQRNTSSYKSVTYLFLGGGLDSYNLLVPHSECKSKDMYAEYLSVRGEAGIPKDRLLQIGTGGEFQVCDSFGIHPKLPILESLYTDGDALIFANTGVLDAPVTRENGSIKTRTHLFAHDSQTKEAQQIDPNQEQVGTGVLGRMGDLLMMKGYNSGSYAMEDDRTVLTGGGSEFSNVYSLKTLNPFNQRSSSSKMSSLIFDMNSGHTSRSGIFGRTWSGLIKQSLLQNEEMLNTLGDVHNQGNFSDTNLGNQLNTISNIIRKRSVLENNRQFFMARKGGFDTHSDLHNVLDSNLSEINDALTSFVKEMKLQGIWDNVLLIVASEFGRALRPNNGGGSDHGWGGNYFMIGGGLNGGRILGEYPDDLTDNGPLVLSRNRIVPTTSWDSIMNGVAMWTGIHDNNSLDKILPNRKIFGDSLYTEKDLFGTNGGKKKMLRH